MLACFVGSLAGLLLVAEASDADERRFTYVYEPDVLPKGEFEFEQSITSKIGREDGDYVQWKLREEIEYGLTDKLTTALYLNFKDTYFSPKDKSLENEREFEFAGVSSEWKYQLSNPYTDSIGSLLYFESTFESDEVELEEKIVLGKELSKRWIAALNATIEQKWKFDHGETEEEAELEFTAGVSYRFAPAWSAGLELRNVREYDGLDFGTEKLASWYVGPNIHYGAPDWWMTLTVLPQIPLESDRNLEDAERVEVRLLAGVGF